jgi:hypothetical protein
LRNKSIFQISTLVCLSSISICNLLTDLPTYNTRNYWGFLLRPSSGILKTLENTAFRKLDVSVLREGHLILRTGFLVGYVCYINFTPPFLF